MKFTLKFIKTSVFVCTFGFLSFAQQVKSPITQNISQEKCGSSERHKQLMQNDPEYAAKRQAEEVHIENFAKNPQVEKAVKIIPVVVHIIHTGQALGSGANISDAQIQSSINNLTMAYRNQAPYNGVDTQIEFCLAQRDPAGNPHSGIIRVNGSSVANYSSQGIISTNEVAVKNLSKWDNTQYYNFWIVTEIDNNGAGAGTQGYAYFPGAGATYDGAVMLYNSFGYDPTGSLGYNLKSYTNRNTTPIHEIGHALNLYHTFEGDIDGNTCPATGNNCGSDVGDCVSDTPPHKRSNSDCLTNTVDATCNNVDRDLYVHNFMDYSSDVCTYQFSSGQSTRMNATLTGSRASLVASSGCNPVYANDVSVSNIVSPTGSFCMTTFSPQVTLKNVGTATLTSATITYNIDGGSNQVYSWTGSLASGATQVVTLNSVTTSSGSHTFNATSTLPNGVTDQYAANNSSAQAFTISSASTLPIVQGFESATYPPTNWSIAQNPSDGFTWERFTSAHSNGVSTACIYMNGYDYATAGGETDGLLTESVSLVGVTAPTLTFKVAYQYYQNTTNYDELRVFASTDCGVTFGSALYNKNGTTLATAGANSASGFVPTAIGNWRTESVDLSSLVGQNVVLKFEFTNRYGQNLYLDDINISSSCSSPVVTSQPANSTNCSGTNTSFAVTNTNGGTYQWQVNSGSGFTNIIDDATYSGSTTAILSLTAVGTSMNTYLYRCVITNACGPTNSNSATLTVNVTPATPTISASGATTFCQGGSVVLTSSSTSGNVWSTGATTQAITVSSTSSNSVTVTISACSSPTSASTNVTVNPNPVIAEGTLTNPSACLVNDGSIQITGSGTGNLSWTGTASGSMMGVTLPSTISTLGSGSYSISFDNGCTSNTVSSTLINPGAPVISFGSITTPFMCMQTDALITINGSGTGDLSYSINGGAPVVLLGVSLPFTQTIPFGLATNANVSYTFVSSGCTSNTISTVLTTQFEDPNGLNLSISANGSTTFCNGGNVVLTSTNQSSYKWFLGGTQIVGETSQSYTATTSGSYYAVTDLGACVDYVTSNTISVTVNAIPSTPTISTSGSTTICSGDNVTLTSSSTTNNVWSTGETTQSITVNTAGNFTLFVSINSCNSSSVSEIVIVNSIPATPTITASGSTTICTGENVVLTSTSSSGNVWSTGETTQSITVNSAGTYTVTEVVNLCSSATSNSIDVVVNSTPNIPTISASGTTTICEGDSVTLTSSATQNNVWSTTEITTSIIVSTAGSYTVTSGTGNCTATSNPIVITVNANPTVSLSAIADMCNTVAPFTLNNGLPANGVYTVDGSTQTVFNPSINTGSNTIIYTFIDVNSCSASATQTVIVNDCSAISEASKLLFNIYPNPTNSKIIVEGEKLLDVNSLELRDELGRLVQTFKGNKLSITIDLSSYADGIYTLVLKGTDFEEIQKIQVIK